MVFESRRVFTKKLFYRILIITIYYKTFVYIRNKKYSFLTDDDDEPRNYWIGFINIWVNIILYLILGLGLGLVQLLKSKLISHQTS